MTDEFIQLASELLLCSKDVAAEMFLACDRQARCDIEVVAEFLEIERGELE